MQMTTPLYHNSRRLDEKRQLTTVTYFFIYSLMVLRVQVTTKSWQCKSRLKVRCVCFNIPSEDKIDAVLHFGIYIAVHSMVWSMQQIRGDDLESPESIIQSNKSGRSTSIYLVLGMTCKLHLLLAKQSFEQRDVAIIIIISKCFSQHQGFSDGTLVLGYSLIF